jgi:protein involved in polysaccharide export with SLBB domain
MRSATTTFAILVAMFFAACAAIAQAEQISAAPAMTYAEATPDYRFFPGDEIEISIFSAPELTRTVTVGPDGRISLPLIAPVRAADRTSAELHDALIAAYSAQLRAPELAVIPKTFASRQVFVGGEVARPGIYAIPADIDAFQAVALAGGFLSSARRGEVLVLSRASGQSVVTEVDLSTNALRQGFPDARPLSRYDVVYVPRSAISHVGLFMQQWLRDALPVQFSLYYDLNSDNGNR